MGAASSLRLMQKGKGWAAGGRPANNFKLKAHDGDSGSGILRYDIQNINLIPKP